MLVRATDLGAIPVYDPTTWGTEAWAGGHGNYAWAEEIFHWGTNIQSKAEVLKKYPDLTLRRLMVSPTTVFLRFLLWP